MPICTNSTPNESHHTVKSLNPAKGVDLLRVGQILALDPGIRGAVLALRNAGFETSDSGDGVSKPAEWYESGEAIAMPHVAGTLTVGPRQWAASIEAMALKAVEVLGEGWTCEVTYNTTDGVWIFFASKPLASAPSPQPPTSGGDR